MEAETRKTEEGTEIRVRTDKEVAVIVKTGEGERIYLPETSGSDTTYYVESTRALASTEKGYAVLHQGDVKDIKVLG